MLTLLRKQSNSAITYTGHIISSSMFFVNSLLESAIMMSVVSFRVNARCSSAMYPSLYFLLLKNAHWTREEGL